LHPILWYYTDICQEALSKTTINLSNSQYTDQDLNSEPREYETSANKLRSVTGAFIYVIVVYTAYYCKCSKQLPLIFGM